MRDAVIAAVCNAYGITVEQLLYPMGKRRISDARKTAVALLLCNAGMRQCDIARTLHTSQSWIHRAWKTANDLYQYDRPFRQLFDKAADEVFSHVL